MNTYSFTVSEKVELIADSEPSRSQTYLRTKYKISNDPVRDILKPKQEYLVDSKSNHCSRVKRIEIVQPLRLLSFTASSA